MSLIDFQFARKVSIKSNNTLFDKESNKNKERRDLHLL